MVQRRPLPEHAELGLHLVGNAIDAVEAAQHGPGDAMQPGGSGESTDRSCPDKPLELTSVCRAASGGGRLDQQRAKGGPLWTRQGVDPSSTAIHTSIMSDHDPHLPLREGVRRICADFPDEYWREREAAHEFPWAFYKALADAGWVGIAIPEEYGGGGAGITEASIVLEEVAASGAAMNGCSAIHLSIFGMNPVVKHGSDGDEGGVPARGSPRASCTCRSASPSPTPAPTRRTSRRGRPRSTAATSSAAARSGTPRPQVAEKCLLLARTTPLEDVAKRTDGMTLFLADLQVPGGRHPADPQARPQRRGVVRGVLRRPVRRRRRPRRRGGPRLPLPARRAQPRAHPARRRGARHRPRRRSRAPSRTPTSGWCSAGRSARTRASRSRSPTRTCGCGPPS